MFSDVSIHSCEFIYLCRANISPSAFHSALLFIRKQQLILVCAAGVSNHHRFGERCIDLLSLTMCEVCWSSREPGGLEKGQCTGGVMRVFASNRENEGARFDERRERRLYERLLNEDISSDRSEVLSLIACDDNRNVPFVPPLVDAGAGPLLMQVQV